jgi:hypothetical protein
MSDREGIRAPQVGSPTAASKLAADLANSDLSVLSTFDMLLTASDPDEPSFNPDLLVGNLHETLPLINDVALSDGVETQKFEELPEMIEEPHE